MEPVALRGDDMALLQYTSGSTGDPKGVVLTHRNLLANLRAIGEVLRPGPGDTVVSWLPLYHDMGLIGAWLGSLLLRRAACLDVAAHVPRKAGEMAVGDSQASGDDLGGA